MPDASLIWEPVKRLTLLELLAQSLPRSRASDPMSEAQGHAQRQAEVAKIF